MRRSSLIKSMVVAGLLFLPISAGAAALHAPPKRSASELDSLFKALAVVQSEEDAQPIEQQIMAVFRRSGSATVDLLLTREQAAANASDTATARRLIDAIVGIAPQFAEGWHQRAILQAAAGDDEGAMISLQKVILLNPRHFAAYAELGGMLADYGNKAGALKMLRRALALDPQLPGIDRRVRELSKVVEGEPI